MSMSSLIHLLARRLAADVGVPAIEIRTVAQFATHRGIPLGRFVPSRHSYTIFFTAEQPRTLQCQLGATMRGACGGVSAAVELE